MGWNDADRGWCRTLQTASKPHKRCQLFLFVNLFPPERNLAAERLHSTNQALGWIPALRKRINFPGWSLYFKKFFPSFVVGSDDVYLGFLRHSWSGICPRLALNSWSSCFRLTCARVTGMCHLKPAFLKSNYIMIIKFGHKCFLGHNVFAYMCGCCVCVCVSVCVN